LQPAGHAAQQGTTDGRLDTQIEGHPNRWSSTFVDLLQVKLVESVSDHPIYIETRGKKAAPR